MIAADDNELRCHMQRTTSFVSHKVQNEIIEIYCHHILRILAKSIKEDQYFGVIVDGTQDISGIEQESTCIRHIDDNLTISESFVGMYNTQNTTDEIACKVVLDVLIRLSLPLSALRAQTYYGAANMNGAYKGCQARILRQQPLAMHFHCGAHQINLIMQKAVDASVCARDAIKWMHELGVLLHRSGKFKASTSATKHYFI